MRKIILLLALLLPAVSFAGKTTMIYTNHRFNFIKLEEMDKKTAGRLSVNHPYTFTEDQMRKMLAAIKLNRSFVLKKEVETQEVFDDYAVKFLAPRLVEAFSKAASSDRVVISYLDKSPQFFFRNDRLTIAYAWVAGSELHIQFEKLMAKLGGDTDKRSDFTKVVARARGLHISLEIGEGQKLGDSTSELVVDLNHDFTAPVAETKPEEPAKKEVAAAVQTPSETPKTAKDRLKELDGLKADGLITEKEYKQKKKVILKDL